MIFDDTDGAFVFDDADAEDRWLRNVGIIISMSDIKRSTLIWDSVGGNCALILSI